MKNPTTYFFFNRPAENLDAEVHIGARLAAVIIYVEASHRHALPSR